MVKEERKQKEKMVQFSQKKTHSSGLKWDFMQIHEEGVILQSHNLSLTDLRWIQMRS